MNTNAKLSNNQNEPDRTFDRIDSEVRRLRTLTATDGAQIPFTGNMKIVYAYLYTFYTNDKRLNYPDPIYPNLRLIAEECGISLPTTKKSIDDLAAAGVLEKHTITIRGSVKSNSYGVMLPADVVARNTAPARQPTHKKPDLKVVTNEEPKNESDIPPQFSDLPAAVESVDDVDSGCDLPGEALQPDFNAECGDGADAVPVILNKRDVTTGIQTLETWINGYDDAGFIEYGKRYGLTKTREIADLIHSHYSILKQKRERNEPKQFRVSSDQQAELRERCRVLEEQKENRR